MKILVRMVAVMLPAAAWAQGAGVQPGMWDVAMTIHSIDMPGQPPEIGKMMAGKTNRVRHCITSADAAKGPQD